MLILARGLKQQIVIGDQRIVVTVLALNGGRVRLGIEAPPDIVIRRLEIVDSDQQHQLEQALATTETERVGCVESSKRTLPTKLSQRLRCIQRTPRALQQQNGKSSAVLRK